MIPHIVFVDDEKDILFLVEFFFKDELSQKSIKLTCFSDSREAFKYLNSIEENDISAFITDINMPNYDGFELLDIISKRKIKALTYLCSAYDRIDYKEKGEQFNIKGFIKKPIHMISLKKTILNDIAAQ